MRDNVREFVRLAANSLQLQGPVYEFGSYLVEGQNDLGDLRDCFPDNEYVGCDMRPGPGVDRVENLERLELENGSAETILCVDTLEHVFPLQQSIREMIRVLKPGGALLITTPLDFPIHNHPSDYWRLTPSCLQRLLSPLEGLLIGWQGVDYFPHTVFALGCKAPVRSSFVERIPLFIENFQKSLAQQQRKMPWRAKWKRWVRMNLQGKGERRRQQAMYQARFVWNFTVEKNWKQQLVHHMQTGESRRGEVHPE